MKVLMGLDATNSRAVLKIFEFDPVNDLAIFHEQVIYLGSGADLTDHLAAFLNANDGYTEQMVAVVDAYFTTFDRGFWFAKHRNT
jgi:hypothetical protein